VPEQPIRIRDREAADIDLCVQALAAVHETSGYPTNWPADPGRWLTPSGIIRAWIAATGELPVAGHLLLRKFPASTPGEDTPGEDAVEVSRLFVVPAARRRGVALALLEKSMHWAEANDRDLVLDVTDDLRAARALYARTGFRLADTALADWTTPDGQPVILHRYVWSRTAGDHASSG
jgi:GNAT superfamily N-acetyltransferase